MLVATTATASPLELYPWLLPYIRLPIVNYKTRHFLSDNDVKLSDLFTVEINNA